MAPWRGASEKSSVFGACGDVRVGARSCGTARPNEKFIGVGNSEGRGGAGGAFGAAGAAGRAGDGGRGTTMASGGTGFGSGISAVAAGGGGSGGVGSGSGAVSAGGEGGGGATATGGGGLSAGGAGAGNGGGGDAGAGGAGGGAACWDGAATLGFGFGSAGPFGVPPSNTIATSDGGGSSSSPCRSNFTVTSMSSSSVRCSHSDMTSTGPSRRARRREPSHGRLTSVTGMVIA